LIFTLGDLIIIVLSLLRHSLSSITREGTPDVIKTASLCSKWIYYGSRVLYPGFCGYVNVQDGPRQISTQLRGGAVRTRNRM
jgi:hypothetical protein